MLPGVSADLCERDADADADADADRSVITANVSQDVMTKQRALPAGSGWRSFGRPERFSDPRTGPRIRRDCRRVFGFRMLQGVRARESSASCGAFADAATSA